MVQCPSSVKKDSVLPVRNNFDPKGPPAITIKKAVGWSSDQNHTTFTFQHGRKSRRGIRPEKYEASSWSKMFC